MRKTKIIGTLGPASSDEGILRDMILAGMNVARMNFSHNTHKEHRQRMELVRKLRKELQVPLAVMLDTKGPEYRIGDFADGKIQLAEGDTFTFTTRDIIGDSSQVSVSYPRLAKEMAAGERILLNNGLLEFVVEEVTDTDILCRVTAGGELSNHKSMSFPGKVLQQVYLSEQDKEDILFGIEEEVDFIACSFVSCKQDLLDVQAFMKEHHGEEIELIAKIENRAGIENIEEICEACSGIMIGRGDLGVEIPYEELPAIQKKLITKCRMMGKRVITATEMLESMINNPRPTRAEASDVANAVYDGTSAVMLSGETAAGHYPVQAIKAMARITEAAEQGIPYQRNFHDMDFWIQNRVDALSHAICGLSFDLDAKAIAVCTLTGTTARMVSRFRSPVNLMAMTTSERTYRRLALSWGVTPVMSEMYPSLEVLLYEAKKKVTEMFALQPGDSIIITGGMTNGMSGNTNLIKVETVTP